MTTDNLARSRRLVEALVERRPEFREKRPEWFAQRDIQIRTSGQWRTGQYSPYTPDLLAPAHLADLFEVCDALCVDDEKAEICFCDGGAQEFYCRLTAFIPPYGRTANWKGEATTRAEALMLAAEAALGCGEEGGGQ